MPFKIIEKKNNNIVIRHLWFEFFVRDDAERPTPTGISTER